PAHGGNRGQTPNFPGASFPEARANRAHDPGGLVRWRMAQDARLPARAPASQARGSGDHRAARLHDRPRARQPGRNRFHGQPDGDCMNRGLLLTMTEPPPAMEEEFNAWYDTEHLA